MKTIFLFFALLISTFSYSQTIELRGAYTLQEGNTTMLLLLVDGYSSLTVYQDTVYKSTTGGPFVFDGQEIEVLIEYNDANSDEVGSTRSYAITITEGGFEDPYGNTWKKEAAKPQDLDGLWRITGRKQGDNIAQIHTSGDRKTIKLLVDGYFQWVAINPSTRGFSGTGGGHYTFADGKYSEHILFFSRDNSRVGASLTFDGRIENEQWHHSGQSSKGDPIYEVWSLDNR